MSVTSMQRMTRQRQLILETLQGLRTHPTVDEVYTLVRDKMPRISLGTVYRNLDILFRSGKALRLERVGNQSRYDGDTTEHWHIRCVRCGRVDDIFRQHIEIRHEQVTEETGYRVIGHSLEYEGVCPICQQAEND
jgi:Fur family transcriptional regulator, ferric uptake regulator